jgi:hypothetical protein
MEVKQLQVQHAMTCEKKKDVQMLLQRFVGDIWVDSEVLGLQWYKAVLSNDATVSAKECD